MVDVFVNGRRAGLAWLALVLLVLLIGCGAGNGNSAFAAQQSPTSVPSEHDLETLAVAETNQANLVLTDDLAHTELLEGRTGAITNLDRVITGDRAVAIWYWAPH